MCRRRMVLRWVERGEKKRREGGGKEKGKERGGGGKREGGEKEGGGGSEEGRVVQAVDGVVGGRDKLC